VTTREQGDLGEASAVEWLTFEGATVATPFNNSPDWDLLAELQGRILRVQVKTSTCFIKRRWSVAVCTRGGNQSWNGVAKRFHRSRCDYLFVLVGDGRRWFIPSDAIEGTTAICLGGPKYAEFEIDRGRPIPRERCGQALLQSAS